MTEGGEQCGFAIEIFYIPVLGGVQTSISVIITELVLLT